MSHRLPLADIQFISDFAVYARERGPTRYDYSDPGNCATCQFLRDTDRAAEPRVVPETWRDGLCSNERFPLPAGMDAALKAECDGGLDLAGWTFSALADRLEALIADAPMVRS